MSNRKLWYGVRLDRVESTDEALKLVAGVDPADVGASAKLSGSDSVLFSVGDDVVVIRYEPCMLLIEAPNHQEAVGVAWQILVALSSLHRTTVWISARAYGSGDLAERSIMVQPMVIFGEPGHSLDPDDFDQLLTYLG